MRKVNSIVLCRGEYKTQEDFENAIKNAVVLLLNANYVMVVRYDEKGLGIVSIDFDYANEELGGALPRWLSPEEEESVVWQEQ